MSKLFLTTMTAFALVGLAASSVPTASAWYCASYGGEPQQTVADTCNYARDEAFEVAGFAVEETNELVAFALDHLP